jgi:hypothetical protein
LYDVADLAELATVITKNHTHCTRDNAVSTALEAPRVSTAIVFPPMAPFGHSPVEKGMVQIFFLPEAILRHSGVTYLLKAEVWGTVVQTTAKELKMGRY